MSYAAALPLVRAPRYPQRPAVGEYYLRQWPLAVAPRVRAYRLARAMAGAPGGRIVAPVVRGVPAWRSLSGALSGAALGGTELPDALTPMTADDAAAALAEGYRRVVGVLPTQQVLGLLLGQTALETGNWQSIHNFNFGNEKSTSSDPYYQNFRCSEIIDGTEQFFDPPDTHCQFAAHLTAADGAEHYMRVLQERPNWWNGLNTGTVDGFITGLTIQPYAYFTANPDLYATGLADRMANYASQAAEYSAQATQYASDNPGVAIGTVIGVFALTFGSWFLYNTVTSARKAAA